MGKQTTIDVTPLMSCLMVLIIFSYRLIIVHDGHLCTWPVLTVQRRWRSCVTWIWATGHSRCQSGTGRTPAAGCGWGSWCGGPGQSRETPGGPGGCSWRRGHSPRRNCRQMNTLILGWATHTIKKKPCLVKHNRRFWMFESLKWLHQFS